MRTLDAELLALGTVDELSADLLEGLDIYVSISDCAVVLRATTVTYCERSE
jgi:hypothetical protein